jgi:hypothetical protein
MVAMRSWIGGGRGIEEGNREHGSLLRGAMRVL